MNKIIVFLAFSTFFCSCKEDSSLTISNELENVILQNIQWDDRFISAQLLPGQSAEIILSPYTTDLPKTGIIHFEMKAANRIVGLRTVDEFEVGEEEDVRIEVDSTLQVTVQ